MHSPSPHHLARFLLALVLPAGALHAQLSVHPWKHPDGTTHWYEVRAVAGGITWDDANRAAAEAGGYLATLTSPEEHAFAYLITGLPEYWYQTDEGTWVGPWLGGVGEPLQNQVTWTWAEPAPFTYTSWTTGHPKRSGGADRLHFGGAPKGRVATWAVSAASELLPSYVIEYSDAFTPLTAGLTRRAPASYSGYTLMNPLGSTMSYLIDPYGQLVQSWSSKYQPGVANYLLPNGNLLRAGNVKNTKFNAGGTGGILEEFDWDNNLVWKFELSTTSECTHHDFQRLPNGNTLLIVWEAKNTAESIAAGRNPAFLRDGEVWLDKIVEIDPSGKRVWEWSVWDHLIQDHDPTKANYGDVSAHPELVDINYGTDIGQADWLHANALHYNAKLDQIMLCVRHFDELWVIDHSTTTAEAAGHTGGRSGKGGDLLYRWGNPQAYRAGAAKDRRLFQQHDAQWIADGLPGAGNILVFNNGLGRPSGPTSSVEEIAPPIDANGHYSRTTPAWGPAEPLWIYPRTPYTEFYSPLVSGAQRLPNGNTLICAGWIGTTLEVTSEGEILWEYVNPISGGARVPQGDVPIWTAAGNAQFRAPRYPADYPGLRGKKLTPRGPLERYTRILLADGSKTPHYSKTGNTVALTLQSPGDAGRFYLAGTSFTRGLIPADYRFVRLGYDDLLPLSMVGAAPHVFENYFGSVDANGQATAALRIPQMPVLVGTEFQTMFLVLDFASRSAVSLISNTVRVKITP